MSIELRDYQLESIEQLRDGIRRGHRCQVLAAPAGSGKTVISAHLLQEVQRKGTRAGFIVDRVALCSQTSAMLWSYDIDHGMVQGQNTHGRDEKIQVCSAQTLEKRDLHKDWDICFFDECFPGDVEILTPNGFVRFDLLSTDAQVAQWRDGAIDFVTPTDHIRKPFSGDLVHIYSERLIDLPMTPGHQMLLRYKGGLRKEAAADVKFNYLKTIPVAGLASAGSTATLTPHERLMIALQADGNMHHEAIDGAATLAFSFVKDRKIDRLHEIVAEGGYTIKESADAQPRRRFMVRGATPASKRVWEHFNLAAISWQKARAIIAEMVEWDGYKGKGGLLYFSSVEECAVDFYQAVAVLAGYRTNKTIQIDDRSESFRDVHRLFITPDKADVGTGHIKKLTMPLDGDVFCVRVPSENIVVRRGGKVTIVGNCHIQRKFVLDYIKNTRAKIIGLTATPFADGMGKVYSNLVNVTTTNKLIADKFLAPLKVYAATPIDMTGAKVVAGEWTDREVESRAVTIIGDIVKEWVEKTAIHFPGQAPKTLVFSATVDHGEAICKQFQAAGYNFQQVSYKDGNDERRAKLIAEFRKPNSEIVGLTSCEALVRGFDVPDVLVGISARPYRSSFASHVQQLGRLQRPAPGKSFGLWLDFTGNYLGFLTQTENLFEHGVHKLDDGDFKKQVRKEVDRKKTEFACRGCGMLISPAITSCPGCGLERQRKTTIQTLPGQLNELSPQRPKLKAYLDRPRLTVWGEICKIARNRKGADTEAGLRFARAQYKNLYGAWPGQHWGYEPAATFDQRLESHIRANVIRWAKARERV